MRRINAYLLGIFSQSYFSIFLPLFAIASVIMLVKIAAFTALIHISLLEMAKPYLFMIPEVLFYSSPVTFFIAAVLALTRLSNDYELVVIFSLGVSPKKIVLFFTKLAIFQSFLLVVLFFFVSPHTKNLYRDFIANKKSEAKFNLQASEYGHKFGDWLLYIGQEGKKGEFEEIIMFNQKAQDETLVLAETATVKNIDGTLKLELTHGKTYNYSEDSLRQMEYTKMYLNDTSLSQTNTYMSTFEFWLEKERRKVLTMRFTQKMLVALFPILSIFFILAIGVTNARHQKSYTYLFIFTAIISYFGISFALASKLGLFNILLVATLSYAIGYYLYRVLIKRLY